MNWGAVGSSAAVAALIGGLLVWAVRAIVREEVAKLNGTYVRAFGSKITGHEIEWRLSKLESRQAK